MHSKLRMLGSELNDYLHSYIHVIESPACPRGHHRENNKHYFLECPLFLNERAVLLDNLSRLDFRPTLANLLYGCENYSDETNTMAFTHIQEYIAATGRFT